MNTAEASHLLRRMGAAWPSNGKLTDDVYEEWLTFLAEYETAPAMRALGIVREVCKWRPSMAEFREAYFQALTIAEVERKQLASGDEYGPDASLQDVYGASIEGWVYCWRCDMAISLDDLEHRRAYDGQRGLHHRSCPRSGSAPHIPAVEKAKRDKWFLDHKISIGPNVDPVPYVETPRRKRKAQRDFEQVSRIAGEYVARHRKGQTP